MASSGSFSGSIHSGHYVLRVDWTQTKNVSVNTSTITAKAYLVNDWSLSINARSDNKVTIDGTAQTYASPAISSTGTHLLGTVTQTVNHGSDGTKSLAMSAVFYIRATLSGTYYESITASANITLDSIARASTVSASNVEMGSATTIAISRASSSFTHTLTYAFGSATGTIATKTTSTSVSWTPPLMLAGQIPKAVTGTGTITCTTYREVDIESTKVDIRNKLLSFSDTISEKTINHTVEIFSKCGKENCFGRTIVEEITGLKPSRASKLIKLLVDSEVIVPVTGHGKGKYRFQ